MDALGCMQTSSGSSNDSSVQFTRHNSSPEYASLLCNFGSFYMWWVNCTTTQSDSYVTAPFPTGVTINHLYYVGSNPLRKIEENSSMLRTNIEPTELKTSSQIMLLYSTGIMTRQVILKRLSKGITCTISANSAVVSFQFVIT